MNLPVGGGVAGTGGCHGRAFIVGSLEEFLRGFATFGMIVHVIEYIVYNAYS
jgi:hypothetical protein